MSPALALAVALQVISCAAAAASPEPVPALILQRSLPLSGTHLERLKEHDRSRLARKGKNGAAAEGFYLDGMPGLYYAHVKLGTPSKEYSLQFDTGSDVLWVSCTPCTGCPTSTELNITLEFYDPNSSSTSSKILCSDNRCTYALETGAAVCNPSDSRSSQCGYTNTYVDGSATSGYYVSDTLHFDAFMRNEQGVSSSASVFFGCSTSRSGNLHTDGIIGFGKNAMSVISQMKTQGMSPKVFSHCLKGSKEGGGILVLGELVEPGLVFTPLVQSQPHYSVNMKSIHVNGKEVSIDSSLFSTSNTKGTIVDSGTSLAYLADGMYGPVTRAIKASVVQSVGTFEDMGDDCYFVSRSNSTASLFPTVTLYFEGGAAITLVPKDYLVLRGYYDEDLSSNKTDIEEILCIGFQRSQSIDNYEQTTILGDLVLHDKVFVFDLETMRMGWVNYNCSLLNTTSSSMGDRFASHNNGLIAVGVAILHTSIIAAINAGIFSS